MLFLTTYGSGGLERRDMIAFFWNCPGLCLMNVDSMCYASSDCGHAHPTDAVPIRVLAN
jgi:hypothetical protein